MLRPMPPAPAQVPYNDWRRLPVAALAAFVPTEPVSVVIPCYQVPAATLAKTLASLERQRFPRHLLEVVLVDDGSEPPLQAPPSPLDVKVVRQERCGYGTWRARNNGVDAAAHDIVLFLDADELAEEEWISAHARWHHAAADVLTAGPRWHVATEGLDVEAIRRGNLRRLLADLPTDPPWSRDYYARSDEQLAKADDLFHVVAGGNFGMRKAFYHEVGGNAPFRHWGGEDIELAFRADAYGALMVPVREAMVWHQGRWAEGREERHRASLILDGEMAHLIPHPRCRPVRPGRTYRVPRHVVAVDAGESIAPQSVVALVERLLADRIHDLAVRVELGPAQSQSEFAREYLRCHFDDEPRVVVRCVGGNGGGAKEGQSALDEFPTAAFHIRFPATATYRGHLVARSVTKLGSAVHLSCALPTHGGEAVVSITRTWALHRAHRTQAPLEAFGDVKIATPSALGVTVAPKDGATLPQSNHRRWIRAVRKHLAALMGRA